MAGKEKVKEAVKADEPKAEGKVLPTLGEFKALKPSQQMLAIYAAIIHKG